MLPRHVPRKEQLSLTYGRFAALPSRALEGLRVRESRVVAMLTALEASIPQEDLLMHRSEPVQVVFTENPRHISVQQSLNHVGLQ